MLRRGPFTGLNYQSSTLTMDAGDLLVADNVSINRDGVIERRKGYDLFDNGFPYIVNGTTPIIPQQVLTISGKLFAQADNAAWTYNETLGYWQRLDFVGGSRMGTIAGSWFDTATNRLYLSDFDQHCIWYLDMTTGRQVFFAGTKGTAGTTDGAPGTGKFNTNGPAAMWGDGTNIYVLDGGAGVCIRQVSLSTGNITTWAGSQTLTGSTNATGTSARFLGSSSLWGFNNVLYVADTGNFLIRAATIPGAVVTTFAGSGVAAITNGTGTAAAFQLPFSITGDGTNIYVSEGTAKVIRALTIPGAVVTTLGSALALTALPYLYTDSSATYIYASSKEMVTVDKTTGTATALLALSTTNLGGPGIAAGNAGTYLTADATHLYAIGAAGGGGDVWGLYRGTNDAYRVTNPYGYSSFAQALSTGTSDFLVNGAYGQRIRGAEYNNNYYLTSARGVLKFYGTDASGNPVVAGNQSGAPKALDVTLTVTGASGFLANGFQAAYRVVWCIRDQNNNLYQGVPSTRRVISNTAGGARNVTVAFQTPQLVTDATIAAQPQLTYFYQVYRTTQAANGTDPGDEEQLAFEGYTLASSISITDLCPDAALGAKLYTNASQQGIAYGNEQPPLCGDMCIFRESVIFAKTTQKHRLKVQLLGTSGITNGATTITIAGVTMTAGAAENTATLVFLNSATGTASVDIEATAQSILRVLNAQSAPTTGTAAYGFYLSTVDTAPGQLIFEERGIGGSAFTFATNAPTMFYTSGTSTNSYAANGIAFSKTQQPEHVPLPYYFNVGPKSEAIERLIALRDSVIIVKTNSVWRLTGTSPADFTWALLDGTTAVLGRDSVAQVENSVMMLSNKGVVVITDAGVQILSRKVERKLLADAKYTQATGLVSEWVASGHESDKVYVLCGPTYSLSSAANISGGGQRICYVYNYATGSWTNWLLNAKCITDKDNRIVYGVDYDTNSQPGLTRAGGGGFMRQRLGYYDSISSAAPAYATISLLETCEDGYTLGVSSISGNALTMTLSAPLSVYNYGTYFGAVPTTDTGWVVATARNISSQTAVTISRVASISGSTIVLKDALPTSVVGTNIFYLYRPSKMLVRFAPILGDSEYLLDNWTDLSLYTETQLADSIALTASVAKDIQLDQLEYRYTGGFNPLANNSAPVSWTVPVDQGASDVSTTALPLNWFLFIADRVIRTTIPGSKAGGASLNLFLSHQEAFSRFAIKSVGVQTRTTGSDRVNR